MDTGRCLALIAAMLCAALSRGSYAQETARQVPVVVVSKAPAPGPVAFAADELARYLKLVTGGSCAVAPPDSPAEGIRVGVASDFPSVTLPSVANPELDDAVYIDVRGASGTIAGSNPRATLLAVYRYLTELGCRWVRPGPDGEYIPTLSTLPDVSVSEAASYRHRGICIEGTNAVEHIRALIDWMPKLGFNSYFVQFEQGYTFFDRWYAHDLNPEVKAAHPSVEQVEGYVAQLEQDVRKRGMLYHKVGHGWTALAFGVKALGWEKATQPPPPEMVPYLAERNGVRKYADDEPLCTNLCYSNPETRRRLCDAIANYAQSHPQIDYLHVWLADGWNNHCECAECRRMRPSDWYVTLLNDLDKTLSTRRLKTRIVFLTYVDLLWPPERERLANPDRFVLMFAPYTRSYEQAFHAGAVSEQLPPFTLNKLEFPKSVDGNVAFLQAWKKLFPGDSFDYDYHVFAQYNDLGQMQLARVVYEDMKNLKELGLNGNVSCQPQRVFFPTGLLMTVMGRTLWNRQADFDSIIDDYFRSAFGNDGPACRKYFEAMTALYHRPTPETKDLDPGKSAADMKRLLTAIDEFQPTMARHAYLENPCEARSWQIMRVHADFARRLVAALLAKAEGKSEDARATWNDALQFAWSHEPDLQYLFDVCVLADEFKGTFADDKK